MDELPELVKCLNCMHVYYETEAHLLNAGTTTEGVTYYNSKCPNCGTIDEMNSEYVGVPREVLLKYKRGEIPLNELSDFRTEERFEEEKRNARTN